MKSAAIWNKHGGKKTTGAYDAWNSPTGIIPVADNDRVSRHFFKMWKTEMEFNLKLCAHKLQTHGGKTVEITCTQNT
jgi:hypothetical protein